MSDIVERLREPDWLTDFEATLVHDAADEIERLREVIRDLGTCVDWYIVGDKMKKRVSEALGGGDE